MRSRLVILAIALVLGLLAAALTGRYLQSLERGVAAEDQPIEVFIAVGDLPKGSAAEQLLADQLIVRQSIPRRYVADGAVSAVGSIEGKVLAESVSNGEQITQARFKFPSQAGLAYSVPPGYVAVAISNTAVKGVAGLVKPQDHVMVVATFDPGPDGEAVTRVILRNVRVLAVGQSVGAEAPQTTQTGGGGIVGGQSAAANEQQATASTITLALSAAELEKLVFAEEKGSVWLALLASGDADVPATAGRTLRTVLEE